MATLLEWFNPNPVSKFDIITRLMYIYFIDDLFIKCQLRVLFSDLGHGDMCHKYQEEERNIIVTIYS
jgi:hypothetical protein